MFDKYELGPGYVSVNETRTINEHRAPTDASVKLLSEMEEKVLRRIVFSEKTTNCELQIFTLVLQPAWDTGDYEFCYGFTLNGKPTQGRVKVPCRTWADMATDLSAVSAFIREHVAADITRAILARFPTE